MWGWARVAKEETFVLKEMCGCGRVGMHNHDGALVPCVSLGCMHELAHIVFFLPRLVRLETHHPGHAM